MKDTIRNTLVVLSDNPLQLPASPSQSTNTPSGGLTGPNHKSESSWWWRLVTACEKARMIDCNAHTTSDPWLNLLELHEMRGPQTEPHPPLVSRVRRY